MKTILIALISLMLFFAGCSSAPTNETTTTTQAVGQTAETTTTEAIATTTTVQTPVATTPQSIRDTLMALSAKVKNYVVSYDVMTQRGNSSPSSTPITFYVNGNDSRLDTSTTLGNKTSESRYYLVNNQSASCGNSNGSWSCRKVKTIKLLTDVRTTMADNIKTSTITQLPDGVVLGANVKCYRLVMNITNADPATARQIVADGMQNWQGTYCGTNDAIMLYYSSVNKNVTVTLEATNYHAGTASSDFALPATPTGISGSTGDLSSGPGI